MMQKQVPNVIVIMGPTASGKSGVAIEIAKKWRGEIISADSRQVYRGLNLGSGKVTGSQKPVILSEIESRQKRDEIESKDLSIKQENIFISEGIIHHLIDVTNPMEDFNISHFKTLANKAIEKILAKGKLPIICGGTGFWIDAVVENTKIPEVAPNPELRKKLEIKSVEELFAELQKMDPYRAQNIDSKNKVRLVRALEICEKLGTVPKTQTSKCHSGLDPESTQIPESSPGQALNQVQDDNRYKFLQIGIKTNREELNAKIQKRLDDRFSEDMIKEVRDLHEKGVSWEWMERIGLEYRWISRFLQNKISEKEMKEKLYFDIIHYAKRQMTWLKRNKEIIWLKNLQDINSEVEKFIK